MKIEAAVVDSLYPFAVFSPAPPEGGGENGSALKETEKREEKMKKGAGVHADFPLCRTCAALVAVFIVCLLQGEVEGESMIAVSNYVDNRFVKIIENRSRACALSTYHE